MEKHEGKLDVFDMDNTITIMLHFPVISEKDANKNLISDNRKV